MNEMNQADLEALAQILHSDDFKVVHRLYERMAGQIAAEKKRADDAIESLNAIRRDFPQAKPRPFKTDIGTKG